MLRVGKLDGMLGDDTPSSPTRLDPAETIRQRRAAQILRVTDCERALAIAPDFERAQNNFGLAGRWPRPLLRNNGTKEVRPALSQPQTSDPVSQYSSGVRRQLRFPTPQTCPTRNTRPSPPRHSPHTADPPPALPCSTHPESPPRVDPPSSVVLRRGRPRLRPDRGGHQHALIGMLEDRALAAGDLEATHAARLHPRRFHCAECAIGESQSGDTVVVHIGINACRISDRDHHLFHGA